ncbi:MAG: hypothetical protein KAW56_15540 [Candidatus Marinimicrobia bacterium]|nr:hypothetical protein [Candidatus Neomarinimicrobiota bacterium]
MKFAQHKHSYMELAVNCIRFYLQFKGIRESLDEPYLTYKPTYEYPQDTIIETQY